MILWLIPSLVIPHSIIVSIDMHNFYRHKFLNSITSNGLLPHKPIKRRHIYYFVTQFRFNEYVFYAFHRNIIYKQHISTKDSSQAATILKEDNFLSALHCFNHQQIIRHIDIYIFRNFLFAWVVHGVSVYYDKPSHA